MILCSSSLVVPSCMQAVEGAHSIVLSYCSIVWGSGARRHGGAVEQEEMMATKSGPSDKSGLTKWALERSPINL